MNTPANPQSVSVLILNDQGELLVVNRKRGTGVCMPGGKVDPGENIYQAAVREIHEETGLAIKACDLQLIYQADCKSEEGVVFDCFTFLATRWQGDLGGQEPELAPRWGRWKDLVENSPFGAYNFHMARDGFVAHLGKHATWTHAMEQWLDCLMEDLDLHVPTGIKQRDTA